MLLSLLILFILFTSRASTQPPLDSRSDLAALYDIRATLGLRSRDWPRKTDPCTNWTGITCRSGRVTALNLSGLRRTRLGRLGPKFAVDGLKNLTRLESFNSTGFSLPGPIPSWFGPELPRSVSVIVLRNADLTGSVPYSLGRLSNLTVLDLAHNRLTGSVPDLVWALNLLKVFDVSFNKLSGKLPNSVRAGPGPNVTGVVFDLSENEYYGSISGEFQLLLHKFSSVNLSGNYFEGIVLLVGENVKNGYFGMNCFKNESNQRSSAECEEFYREKGLTFDGLLSPKAAPSIDSYHENNKKRKKKSHVWKYILAGVLGFVGVVIAVVLVFMFCFMRKRARTSDHGGGGGRSVNSVMAPPSSARFNGEAFTYEQLVRATSEFSGTNLIKKGHSGDLYHGVLVSGFSVVVKRIDLGRVRHEGYVMELNLFARASHTRLVPFLGHCSEESEKFIVYKHMLHGDLATALYKKKKVEEEGFESLDWITRLKIAVGVAEALCFLHDECDPPLVHRDVQASSILLEDKFEVRLGSLSEVCVQERDEHNNVFASFLRRSQTSESRGASGSSTSSCTYDIYCFGKVLLELITGKLGISASSSSSTDPTFHEFLDSTLRCIDIYDKDSVSKIVDPSLVLDEDFILEAWAVAVIAKACLNPKPSKRPPARYVLKALENPLKVMRLLTRSGSARLRTTSSRASWHNAFFGSWRQSSSDIALGSGPLRQSSTVRSQGSGGEHSFSHKRHSVEIFPEPSGTSVGD